MRSSSLRRRASSESRRACEPGSCACAWRTAGKPAYRIAHLTASLHIGRICMMYVLVNQGFADEGFFFTDALMINGAATNTTVPIATTLT